MTSAPGVGPICAETREVLAHQKSRLAATRNVVVGDDQHLLLEASATMGALCLRASVSAASNAISRPLGSLLVGRSPAPLGRGGNSFLLFHVRPAFGSSEPGPAGLGVAVAPARVRH